MPRRRGLRDADRIGRGKAADQSGLKLGMNLAIQPPRFLRVLRKRVVRRGIERLGGLRLGNLLRDLGGPPCTTNAPGAAGVPCDIAA